MTPQRVIVQVGHNQVTEGFFIVVDDLLTMTLADGRPVQLDLDGAHITHRLRPDDKPRSIAAVLTRKIRQMMNGDEVPGFSDPLNYKELGWL